MSATPIKLPWMNSVLGPPSPNAKVSPLPIHTDGRICTSVWQLDDESLAWVIKNRCIVVQVWSGHTQPPIGICELQQELEEGK